MPERNHKIQIERIGAIEVLFKTNCLNSKERKIQVKCLCCGHVDFISNEMLNFYRHSHPTCCDNCQQHSIGRHGLSKAPEYKIWSCMKARCYNKNNNAYKNYGGRGICVCKEWKNDPLIFVNWLIGNAWEKGLEIDRRDNNGNYCPENCRIVTRKENANNRRTNVIINVNGEKLTLTQLSEKYNISYNTLQTRRRRGWKDQDLIKPPVNL